MIKKILIGLIACACLLIFTVYSSEIDPRIAIIPFNSTLGKFYGEVHLWCKIIYFSVPVFTGLLIVVSLWLLLVKNRKIHGTSTKRAALIIFISLALGPGLTVNTILKDNWGRPRPYQVIRDGKTFAPVWKANFKAPANNSFPCGHASIGFFLGVPLLAFGFRRRGLVLSLIGGAGVGAVRMLQGGHYLSDVIYCGIIVWLIAELVTFCVNRNVRGSLNE